MRALWLAFGLLTRLPVPIPEHPGADELGRSALAYPLVGLVVGLVVAGLGWLLPHGSLLAAALVVAGWVALTGALHLDGLADTADGWLGGHGDPRRTLEVMHDPRTGPAGVVAVVVVLVVKVAAVAELTAAGGWPALVLAPTLGRAAALSLFRTTPYVRPQGMGAAIATNLPRHPAAAVLAGVGVLTVALGGLDGLVVLAVGMLAFSVVRYALLGRLGGVTGDAIGATVELIEAVVLAVFALAL